MRRYVRSAKTQRFLALATSASLYRIETVLPDNGREFMKHFARAMADHTLHH